MISFAEPDLRKISGRSMISSLPCFVTIDGIAYAFTVGATESIIDAKVLAGHIFLPNEVYVRTNGDLFCLDGFKHLTELEALLPSYFRTVNRGVAINGLRIGFPSGRHWIGFRLVDHQGRRHEEKIRLSDNGRQVIAEFIVTPDRRRRPRALDVQKKPPSGSFSPGN